MESNGAVGSCDFNVNVERCGCRKSGTSWKTFNASNVAPSGPPSSCEPTISCGLLPRGGCLPSKSAGNRPSPTRFGGPVSWNSITSVFGSPAMSCERFSA
jgi:hypothetical protein